MDKLHSALKSTSKALETPINLIRNVSKIEILSNDTITIELHRGILHYDDEQIDINCSEFVLRILGFNLILRAISNEDLVINGDIRTIDFIL